MTEAPQREYIITEATKAKLIDYANAEDAEACIRDILKTESRPHTAAPEQHVWTEEEVAKEISEAFDRGYDAGEHLQAIEASRAATLAVLKKLLPSWIKELSKPNDDGVRSIPSLMLEGKIEQFLRDSKTLRHQTRPYTPAPDTEHLIKDTKLRIRHLFLDDSKCELCEKVAWDDGYCGQSEGCEKGLCIECAIHKALVEFSDAIARTATLATDVKWSTALNTLIATESKRRDNTVDMVYSYRIAQIIESLRKRETPL
jgi:hypothetical protein